MRNNTLASQKANQSNHLTDALSKTSLRLLVSQEDI